MFAFPQLTTSHLKYYSPKETLCMTGHFLANPSDNCVQLINKVVLRTILNCLAFRDLINWLITVKVIVELDAAQSQCHNLGTGGRATVSEKE